jgi:hypothetical protein
MNEPIRKLKGANMDIDLVAPNENPLIRNT